MKRKVSRMSNLRVTLLAVSGYEIRVFATAPKNQEKKTIYRADGDS